MNYKISKSICKKRHKKNELKENTPLLIFFIFIVVIMMNQSIIRQSIEIAIKLCLSSIIPAIFPFMILSDYVAANFSIKDSKTSKVFQKLFSLNGIGALPFIVGNICGFPLGAKLSSKLYEDNCITKEDYEKLIPICSNPSLAFVFSAVGCGMRNSALDGLILYIIIVISTIITGIIWKNKNSAFVFHCASKQNCFSIVESIKSSALSCIYVSSYVIFFSIISNLIKHAGLPNILSIISISFLEIGNASYYISNELSSSVLSLPLTAFSLGFSGISVYMQSICFSPEDINNRLYIKMKMTEGIIAFILSLIISLVMK